MQNHLSAPRLVEIDLGEPLLVEAVDCIEWTDVCVRVAPPARLLLEPVAEDVRELAVAEDPDGNLKKKTRTRQLGIGACTSQLTKKLRNCALTHAQPRGESCALAKTRREKDVGVSLQ